MLDRHRQFRLTAQGVRPHLQRCAHLLICGLLVACGTAAPVAPAAKADAATASQPDASQDTAAAAAGDATATIADVDTDIDAHDAADAAEIAADVSGVYPIQPASPLPIVPPRFAIPPDAKAGKWQEGVWILPNGRLVTPTGEQVFLGAYPFGITAHPNGKTLYVVSGGKANSIQVVDVASRKILQTLVKPNLYRWLAPSPDGKWLYASGGPSASAYRFAIQPDGTLQDNKTYTTPYGFFGIALAPDGEHLFGLVASGKLDSGKLRPQLWKLSVNSGKAEASTDLAEAPYDLAISPDGQTAWLVTWKGGKVQRVDLGTLAPPGPANTIELGWNGQGIAISPDGTRVYASSVEGDYVAAIDAATAQIIAKIPLNFAKIPGMAPQGRDPGFLRVSPDGKRVYVVCAMSNEVMVIDTKSNQVVGTLPTASYPAGVAISSDSTQLFVINSKGTGFPQPWPDVSLYEGYLGTLSIIPIPKDDVLQSNQQIVLDNMLGVQGIGRIPATPAAKQVLPDQNGSQQIRHVVYLMRENKTFDVELGDLAGEVTGVTADPKFALFGEEYTPNLHKLAKSFCLLDNFYTDGDYSALGHSFAVAGKASDYIEKFYRLSDKGAEIAWGVGESSRPGRGFFFHNVLAHGLTAQGYGQIAGMIDAWSLTHLLHPEWPGLIFNLTVHDKEKALWYSQHIQSMDLPNFSVLVIPNNHTCCGGDPVAPSPKSMVADNDEATGIIVEALSKHKDWQSTVVFIFEDDPQDGGDSVEYHRSPLIVVSPWAKRGHVNHDHHATGGIHATMERILGTTPLTELDALASPIYGCFTGQSDATPYQHIDRIYPETLNKDEVKKKWTKSMHRQWQAVGAHRPDEFRGLGRLLWLQYKGTPAPWPDIRYSPLGEDLDDD